MIAYIGYIVYMLHLISKYVRTDFNKNTSTLQLIVEVYEFRIIKIFLNLHLGFYPFQKPCILYML